jgi:2'-hydroxyisoflavone reductase
MKLLVLGGTIFVGRHVVETALAREDEVTLFNRGRHGSELFPEVEKLRGDRDGGLGTLAGRSWDAVVDTSGYFPRIVEVSARALADRVEHYTFVSSASVYADTSRPGIDEGAPVHALPPAAPEELGTPEAYGAFKALSERAAEEAMPGRVLSVRAGLVVGPHDPTNRFTYWVTRIARGGDVLVPEPRDQPVQIADARDLADWILRMADRRAAGIFNAAGPERPYTTEELLTGIHAAVESDARLVWVDEQFLLEAGVEAFQDLPLWLAPGSHPELAGFLAIDASRALAAGLRFRPLAETVRDTLAWTRRESPGRKDVGVELPAAGIPAERERELLELWRKRAA